MSEQRTEPGVATWSGFVLMCLGMFMAILDIQVVATSLPAIQDALGISRDAMSWIQTAYLIAEVIAIPLSGFLSRALGTRVLFATAAAGFTLASVMCGFTTTIGGMIFWRAIQGFIGGGMVPTVFASAYVIFPRSRQAFVGPIIGLIATLAPTIGPTVGGYLTDALSWHWLFFINIVPGIGVAAAVSYVGGGLLLDATSAPTTLIVAGLAGMVCTVLVALTLPKALRGTRPDPA